MQKKDSALTIQKRNDFEPNSSGAGLTKPEKYLKALFKPQFRHEGWRNQTDEVGGLVLGLYQNNTLC